ncbi:conjugal transfer protein TraF [Marinagarivorans algicola]|uniref:conjugal transfer protein TraF n=1 Tax=Marinagarivorans algicola TaxID=1513270 RepID=UPI0006B4C13A|nr:conjugal transfer protein TraF [Marinagarivorans algicola]
MSIGAHILKVITCSTTYRLVQAQFMWKPVTLLLISLVIIPPTYANSNLLNHSQGITTGQSANHHALFSGIANPAMGHLAVRPSERFRLAYFFSLSSATELGQVDNFVDDIDELINILEDSANAGDIPVNETLDRFNLVITQAGQDGYLKTTNGIYLPPFPLYWRPLFLPGTLTFEFNIESQINVSALADELIYDDQKETFSTATSAYLKSGLQTKFAVSYSQSLSQDLFGTKGTQLLVGARLNIYDLELSKQVFQLELLRGQGIEDLIKDEYKNNRIKSTGIGLDFGAIWSAKKYRLGATITNVNAPAFHYGAIGVNCDKYIDASHSQSNCYIANYFSNIKGDIKTHEQHTKNPVITLDGSYFISPKWLVSAAAELSNYDDTVGQENQWVHWSSSYQPNSFWVPSTRVSYRKNLAGSKLSYAGIGLTLGKVVNIDFNFALDDVIVDTDKVPRGIGFALSIEEWF